MKTYPINLLLEGKKCIVVGGGKVATRKLQRLMEVKAVVTVISPKPTQAIIQYALEGKITLLDRSFDEEKDFENVYLAYFATDDRALNKKLLNIAQSKKIISCCVDRNWHDADFITPAAVSSDDLTIAISSEGVACRKTKLIKENIGRHIESIETTELVVIGTDHNYMTLKEREQIHLNGEVMNEVAEKLGCVWGVHGFALLNTCNRVEFFGAAQCSKTVIEMIKLIMGFDHFSEDKYYVKTGYEAFEHMCLTGSGMYSQTPGENHISAQIKEACNIALEHNWAGTLIQSLSDNIIHVTRQIRAAVAPILKSYEIEDLALKYILDTSGTKSFENKTILIAGTGIIGQSLREKLQAVKNCELIVVYYSQKPKSADNVTVVQLDDIAQCLPLADYVITAMSSPKAIINATNSANIRKNAIAVDLGLPRNIDFEIDNCEANSFDCADIEDLKHWHRKYNCDLNEVRKIADNVINEHKDIYERFRKSFIDGRQGQ
ncbi:NAD(P)-dependent oxidoreductase [Lentisphaerota bacterium WC36G]|nr:hypothetical protein LJT99_14830 [Lentisphaerae bacterium WC36]